MLIILEGPDGAGKTTLAQNLAAQLSQTTSDKIQVWHAIKPTSHPLDEYLRPLRSYRPGTGHHLILDRWHWGERVYPRILNRDTALDEPVWWAIEAYLRRLGAIVVHCERASRAEYVDTYRRRGVTVNSNDAWQYTHLDRIRLEFSRTTYRTCLPNVEFTYGEAQNVDFVLHQARLAEESYRDINAFTTYLGPRAPRALLLGDVRNADLTDNLDPAFVPFRGTSGHFLLRALTSQPSRDWARSFGLANACDVDDVVKLHDALGWPPLVALGRNAARRLDDLGLRHGTVSHPQYVRRFHHGLVAEYGWMIYNAQHSGEDLSKWPQSSRVPTDETPTSTSSPRSDSSDRAVPVATVPPVT